MCCSIANLVAPKAGAKHEQLFIKPAFGAYQSVALEKRDLLQSYKVL